MISRLFQLSLQRSLSARRAWIEMLMELFPALVIMSLSARRAWIEISVSRYTPTPKPVALRKESVDRNGTAHSGCDILSVALRKESVDRNIDNVHFLQYDIHVALRKESVDRNFHVGNSAPALPRSLSARRAWIEMSF